MNEEKLKPIPSDKHWLDEIEMEIIDLLRIPKIYFTKNPKTCSRAKDPTI